MTCPSDRSINLSICWYSLLEGWWMEVMMVRPPEARERRVCSSLRAVVESRPLVGSSRNSTEGLMSSSWPMDTRLRSPPDTPRIMWLPMMVSLHLLRPRPCSTISTRDTLTSCDQERGRRSTAAKYNVSNTVSSAKRRSSWLTKPSFLLDPLLRGAPLKVMVPVVRAVERPPSTVSKLLFPEPEGPIRARSSPGCTQPDTLNKT
mmetsp:Transcript_28218/g.61952  ORF Transcript_28218/g.61952 Transcript_28218/m.61952 type:complete len:204 (-) Transcript_28218:591-1202(-)